MWQSILFGLAILALIATCASACCASKREHPDAGCYRCIIVLLALITILCTSDSPRPQIELKPTTTVTFWNRDSRLYKGGWQVTNYRHPNPHLPAIDYMMGVELAKTNACSFFDLSRDTEIDRLKRCFHFFPVMRQEYVTKYEERIGICI